MQQDAPGWRGPGEVVDLSRLEHGRIGLRTNTDQVITCRLQDVAATSLLSPMSSPLAASQANQAQQVAQSTANSLRPGTVLTFGHVRTADGQSVETPRTGTHRAAYQASMFIADTVFRLP